MKNKITAITKIEELKDRCWLYYEDEKGEPVFIAEDEDIAEAAKRWNISTEAVKGMKQSLDNVVQCIVDTVVDDLRDVWQLADCAHHHALDAMQILLGDDDECEPDTPNEENCRDCEWWDAFTKTCKQPPDAD
jgi:hypothetical protein